MKNYALKNYGPGVCPCVCTENHPEQLAICEDKPDTPDGAICYPCIAARRQTARTAPL